MQNAAQNMVTAIPSHLGMPATLEIAMVRATDKNCHYKQNKQRQMTALESFWKKKHFLLMKNLFLHTKSPFLHMRSLHHPHLHKLSPQRFMVPHQPVPP